MWLGATYESFLDLLGFYLAPRLELSYISLITHLTNNSLRPIIALSIATLLTMRECESDEADIL